LSQAHSHSSLNPSSLCKTRFLFTHIQTPFRIKKYQKKKKEKKEGRQKNGENGKQTSEKKHQNIETMLIGK
jgi:hypothetical protein